MPGEPLEWWPDGGGGLLWREDGTTVPVDSLPLQQDLGDRLRSLVQRLRRRDRLPIEDDGDGVWLQTGGLLLQEVRAALARQLLGNR